MSLAPVETEVNVSWPSGVDYRAEPAYTGGVSTASAPSSGPETATAADDVTTAGGSGLRSDRTRDVILQAARAQFASRGYHRTTIRSVATAAEIDPAMVMRYYRNKAGLFEAAMARTAIPLPDLRGTPRSRLGEQVVRFFINRWEGDPADDPLAFLIRSAVNDEASAERLREVFATQVATPMEEAIGGDDAERRIALVATQMLGLALCRYILRLEPVVSMDLERLREDLAVTVERYLTGPLADIPRPDAAGRPSVPRRHAQPRTAGQLSRRRSG
jgi:AcrR family transcriptional regulator